MRMTTIVSLAVLVLIAVWFVAIAPRVDLGASRVEVAEAKKELDRINKDLEVAKATLVVERAEIAKATLLLMKSEANRAATAKTLQAIEAKYSNYVPKDRQDESTKCLYLMPPPDLRGLRQQD